MIVIGLLLTVLVTTSMGQNSSNPISFPSNATVTSNDTSPSSQVPTTDTTQSNNTNFGFDCRRWVNSCNNRSCDLTSGKCICDIGNFSYNCQDISPDNIPCVSSCENGGVCHGGKCVCTPNFYGNSCNLTRAQVLCTNKHMFVNINPTNNFTGLIYVQGLAHQSCKFDVSNRNEAVDFTTQLERFPALEGQWRVLEFTDLNATCGNASITSSGEEKAFEFKIYVQYMPLFKSAVDQIVVARCVVSNGTLTVSSSDVSNVTDNSGNLDQVNAEGKVDAVTLKVLSADRKTPVHTVTLGDVIHLIFSMPITSGSTYTDFCLKSCNANNTVNGAGQQNLTFIENGCPTPEAKAIFSGEPKHESTNVSRTIDVTLKAFMFVGNSSYLGFICTVDLCPQNNTGLCQQTCGAAPDTAPITPTADNSTTQAPPSSGSPKRRKRDTASDTKEATVGTQGIKVEAAGEKQEQDESTNNNGEVTGHKPVAESCPVDQQFVVAVATLAACVFLLLLLSGFLIFQLMNSKKSEPERPNHYPRPVEGLRFPRLEMSSTHENAL